MIVREETPADHDAIAAVVTSAFGQPAEAELVARLRADGDSRFSLIAVADGLVVGHVLFSVMTAPFRALALAPVSVLPARQRAGIGARLIRTGLARAADAGWQAVFVLGEPAYYRRFGFDAALAAGFESPYAGPYLMVLPLGAALPATVGRIDYAAAFAGLS